MLRRQKHAVSQSTTPFACVFILESMNRRMDVSRKRAEYCFESTVSEGRERERERELTEFCGTLGEFCKKIGESALARK